MLLPPAFKDCMTMLSIFYIAGIIEFVAIIIAITFFYFEYSGDSFGLQILCEDGCCEAVIHVRFCIIGFRGNYDDYHFLSFQRDGVSSGLQRLHEDAHLEDVIELWCFSRLRRSGRSPLVWYKRAAGPGALKFFRPPESMDLVFRGSHSRCDE